MSVRPSVRPSRPSRSGPVPSVPSVRPSVRPVGLSGPNLVLANPLGTFQVGLGGSKGPPKRASTQESPMGQTINGHWAPGSKRPFQIKGFGALELGTALPFKPHGKLARWGKLGPGWRPALKTGPVAWGLGGISRAFRARLRPRAKKKKATPKSLPGKRARGDRGRKPGSWCTRSLGAKANGAKLQGSKGGNPQLKNKPGLGIHQDQPGGPPTLGNHSEPR